MNSIKTDLVSVIIPIFNVEKYLNRCLDSVINQTYMDLEIILIDDGSSDHSSKICDEYVSKDARVSVIHKKNEGQSIARNTGLSRCSGEYIAFIDSDDWIDEKYVEHLIGLLKDYKADISVCNYYVAKGFDIVKSRNIAKVNVFSNIEALNQQAGSLYMQMVVVWGKLIKRSVMDGITFPVGKSPEDEYVLYRILYKASRIVYTTEKLIYYFQRPDSIMGQGFNLRSKLYTIEVYDEKAVFFESLQLLELRDKTYRSLFAIYRSVLEYWGSNKVEDIPAGFYENFKKLRSKLRLGKFHVLFRIFFEMYYIFPRTSAKLGFLYRRIVTIRKVD